MVITNAIDEMIDMFLEKKRRKRAKYDFGSEKRRKEAFVRYNSGKYLDESRIYQHVNQWGSDEVLNLIVKLGGESKCFWIVTGDNGICDAREGIERIFYDGMGGMAYFGNGIGFFEGEQCIGSPERYILVNKTKKGIANIFDSSTMQ